MPLVTYTRPSGTQITVNDCPETRALAAELGWTVEKPKAEKPDKKGK